MSTKTKKKQFMYTTCSELVVFMYWTGKSMSNLLSYCGLVVAKISASEKDLPVFARVRFLTIVRHDFQFDKEDILSSQLNVMVIRPNFNHWK